MYGLPEKLEACFTSVSEGIFGYYVVIPKGFEVIETLVHNNGNVVDPFFIHDQVVGIRLRRRHEEVVSDRPID